MAATLEDALALNESNEDFTPSERIKFVVSNDFRTIKKVGSGVFGVYNDSNVQVIDWEIPRYYHDEDLASYGARINYSADEDEDIYLITDYTPLEDRITFTWTVSRAVFRNPDGGTVIFALCLRLIGENDKPIKELNTKIYKATFLPGLEVDIDPSDEPIVKDYLSQIAEIASDVHVTAEEVEQTKDEVIEIKDDVTNMKDEVSDMKDAVETSVTHYPKIQNGTWRVWDVEHGEWVDTQIYAEANSITGISKTGTSGLVDIYTITFVRGESFTFGVTNAKSITGIAYVASSGLVDTYVISFNDGTSVSYDVTNGKGISSITKTGTVGLVDTYRILYNDGDHTDYNVANGKGISKIEKISTANLVDTYRITYNDGTTQDYEVGNGKGITSIEKTGTSGLVDIYTITYNNGTTTTYNVANGKGITSIAKTSTEVLVDTYTITYNDGTTSTYFVNNGKGVTSIAKTGTSGLTDTYRITYNDGTYLDYTVTNGRGITSIEKTSSTELVDTYTITYNDGTTSTFEVTNAETGHWGSIVDDINDQSDLMGVFNGVRSIIATTETSATATKNYVTGEYVIIGGYLYKVTAAVANGETFVVGTNITIDKIANELNAVQVELANAASEATAQEIAELEGDEVALVRGFIYLFNTFYDYTITNFNNMPSDEIGQEIASELATENLLLAQLSYCLSQLSNS